MLASTSFLQGRQPVDETSRDDGQSREKREGMDRRKFLSTLGAAAAAGAFLGGQANAASQQYYYQDSFGDIVPAGDGAIELGIYPPPVTQGPGGSPSPNSPAQGEGVATTSTAYSDYFPRYNILLILVDQMRNPALWLPAGGQSQMNNSIPYISGLADKSFYYPHYDTCAAVCGPARAGLLTGLYSQQHCIFRSSAQPLRPYNPTWDAANNINPGFPTIGNVLSQMISANVNGSPGNISYDCAWIGKWHLGCYTGTADNSVGQNGPSDYGFGSNFSLPRLPGLDNPYPGTTSRGYPSPNGLTNEGAAGDFLDSYTSWAGGNRNLPNWGNNATNGLPQYSQLSSMVQLNDAAIADAFTDFWLKDANINLNTITPTGQLLKPWFCAVSFVNPHDISDFPYAMGLAPGNSNFFAPPSGANNTIPPEAFYWAPPDYATPNTYPGNSNSAMNITIPVLPNVYSALPPGMGNTGHWNWEDLTSNALQYANNGKPGFQYYFYKQRNRSAGGMYPPGTYNNSSNSWQTPTPWATFLNYYLWLQSCVDYYVGQVLGTNPNIDTVHHPGLLQSAFQDNTVVIFTSDHGDYAGSHGMHAKGGAAYAESLNVPFYVSYPSHRNNTNAHQVRLPYTCSSVDLLPFLYALALGNDSWRSNPDDMVYYLRGREAIRDAIYRFTNNHTYEVAQRRLSGILLRSPATGGQNYQPYTIYTADDYPSAILGNSINDKANYHPSHIVSFRTVDRTDVNNNSAPFYPANSYGGGKLGIYSFWDTCDQTSAPIYGINNTNVGGVNAGDEYEFYNYSSNLAPLRANPEEVGNQYFDGNGGVTPRAQLYLNWWNYLKGELYNLNNGSGGANTQQVQAAIQVAFQEYLTYLQCSNSTTGNDGRLSSCGSCPTTPSPTYYDHLFDLL